MVVAIVLTLLRQPVLRLLGADSDTYAYASQYYTFIVLGAPFMIVSYTPSNLLRTEGFARASMAGSVLGAVINMILDPVFIFALGLGAAGAAIATVLGTVCTDIFFVYVLLTKSQCLSISPTGFHITLAEAGQVFAIGIPASVTNFMQSLGITLTNRFLLPYGNDKVAAMGIVMKANLIVVLILVGFAFGAQPLIGYNYGSGNKEQLKQTLSFCYKFECATAAILAIALSLAAHPLISAFIDDPAMIENGVPMLRMQQVGMVFIAIVLVTTCTFQSAGKARGAFLLSVSRQGLIFAVVIAIASHIAGYYGVLIAQAVSDFFTALAAIFLFRLELSKELI